MRKTLILRHALIVLAIAGAACTRVPSSGDSSAPAPTDSIIYLRDGTQHLCTEVDFDDSGRIATCWHGYSSSEDFPMDEVNHVLERNG